MQGKEHFCPMIWEDLSVKNDGDIRPCCHFDLSGEQEVLSKANGETHNFRTSNYADIANHEKLKEMRAQFLLGKWPRGCERCKNLESLGMSSMRIHRIDRAKKRGDFQELAERVEKYTAPDGSIDLTQFPLREIDLRFNNHCNLRCRHCGPVSSNLWYSESLRFGESKIYEGGKILVSLGEKDGRVVADFDRSDWSKNLEFSEKDLKDFSQLKRIYFAGGEPLLQKKHTELLEFLISNGNSHEIELEYNTNLTYLSEKHLELWKNFSSVGIGVSLDGVEKHFEYIRYPAKFSKVLENLIKLDESPAKFKIWLSYTVNVLNVCHLPDAIAWVIRQKFRKIGTSSNRPPISVRMLHSPQFLNLQNMPKIAKKYVADSILLSWKNASSGLEISDEKQKSVLAMLKRVLAFMDQGEEFSSWRNEWDSNRHLDVWRNQNFAVLEPELARLLVESIANPEVNQDLNSDFSAKLPSVEMDSSLHG